MENKWHSGRQWVVHNFAEYALGHRENYDCKDEARARAESLIEGGASTDDVFLLNSDDRLLMLKWEKRAIQDRKARGLEPRSEYFGPGGAGGE
jgi:hypothetical protein